MSCMMVGATTCSNWSAVDLGWMLLSPYLEMQFESLSTEHLGIWVGRIDGILARAVAWLAAVPVVVVPSLGVGVLVPSVDLTFPLGGNANFEVTAGYLNASKNDGITPIIPSSFLCSWHTDRGSTCLLESLYGISVDIRAHNTKMRAATQYHVHGSTHIFMHTVMRSHLADLVLSKVALDVCEEQILRSLRVAINILLAGLTWGVSILWKVFMNLM